MTNTNNHYGRTLGINGLGRIGKLTLWLEASRSKFDRIVVNVGREVGKGFTDLVHYISTDSTYGSVHRFLNGVHAPPCVKITNASTQELEIDGTPVKILSTERNPAEIPWAQEAAKLVVDTTGQFLDPCIPAEAKGGSVRGHLAGGARLVVTSAPFKIKDKKAISPNDSVMLIQGINDHAFNSTQHCVVSAASCTTTALAHMMYPLLENDLTKKMLTASMSTIHASTNSQSVLDKVPKTGAKDLRKNRSALNNIILTSTGAARALEEVLPEIARIGFMADSVRVPTLTASLLILNCTFQTKLNEKGESQINRKFINDLYQSFGEIPGSGVLFSTSQNVSTDIIGNPAAVVIEGVETHTRTGFTTLNLKELIGKSELPAQLEDIEVPFTHLKVFGWYDNEFGSYTQRMCDLVDQLADQIT